MKTFVTLLTILIAMFLVVPAFAGEEPYKAAVTEDTSIPEFYLSDKALQFTHPDTCYYDNCPWSLECDSKKVTGSCIPWGICWLCPSRCTESFDSDKAIDKPEVCDVPPQQTIENTALISYGNDGWYKWVIALPKKPEGEINLELECGILKPNSAPDQILECAAETGEQVAPGTCVRKAKSYLNFKALPYLTAMAFPGGQNNFVPFHLTAYKNPGTYKGAKLSLPLQDTKALQVLNGVTVNPLDPLKPILNPDAHIALKACMEKSILIKWPVIGQKNALGETEDNLEAGDLIFVWLYFPPENTVDVYCGKYSLTIGGIGEPPYVPDSSMPCKYDCGL